MRRRRLWIGIGVGVAFMFVGCNGLAAMNYFCSECGTDRDEIQLCLPKNRRLVTIYGWETPTVFTAMKRVVEPGPCKHRWVYASGRGGSFIDPAGAAPRRHLLVAMHNLGIVESAGRVNAANALELIRWTLRNDISDEDFQRRCLDADSRPVEFDSDPAFRRWFEEFRPKPVTGDR